MRCLCLFKMSASARVPLLLLLLLSQEKLCIVTEYASNGNLHDYIQCSRRKLPEDLVWKLFIQVCVTSHAYRHRWANFLGGK